MDITIQDLVVIAKDAGTAIMNIYTSNDFEVEVKDDNSPLTKADRASHEIISSRLQSLYPEIPIISEEGKNIPYDDRSSWEYFWLVDPLDGTKEFINKNGEFTVNIALMNHDHPIAGVIYAPAVNEMYFADRKNGAYKQSLGEQPHAIATNSRFENGIVTIQSRSHTSAAETEFFGEYQIKDAITKGSSLKFCLVAESKADLYYRSGPTWEWDTAAGHAIVEIAGGTVRDGDQDLKYNKPSLKNSDGFVCAANSSLIRS